MKDLTAQVEQLQALLPQCQVRDRLHLQQSLERLWPARNSASVGSKLARFLTKAEASAALTEKRRAALPRPEYPEELPVAQRAPEIIRAIREHQVVILSGATGSGKTTQLPKMCLDAGFGAAGRIACTQPRRVAALSVSRRIAEELKVTWGKEVGCKIRFTDHTAPETAVKMMTDGMLLSELQADPDLLEYEVVIVDEAHERSLNIDFLLGYLNLLRERRKDLKIIITSATIDTEVFSKAFGDAPIIEVSGRTYPVEVRYCPLDEVSEEAGEVSYIDAACRATEDLVAENRPGDILIFLPGERDIRELRDLFERGRLNQVEILPLFGRLTGEEQQRIFAPSRRRKIILATNIAETSITVPGIRYVIDTGLARVSRYSPHTHTLRLPIEPISRSSADQRKGRCGRVAEGVCIRLYTEADYESRPRFTLPEILRSNLASVILRMMAFRIGDIFSFPFVDPPQERAIRAGFNLLHDLGAIDEVQQLTPLGRQLAKLPVDPTVGRMLLQARKEGALKEVLVIASGLSIQDPRERPMDQQEEAERMHRTFRSETSDFLSLLNIWNAFHSALDEMTQNQLRKYCKKHFLSYQRMREWRDIHHQLERNLKDMDLFHSAQADADYRQVHRSLLTGLLGNIAERDMGNHYRATHNRNVMLFPGSTLFDKQAAKAERQKHKGKQKPSTVSGKRTPRWIMCAEWAETTRLYARTCAGIEMSWVAELARHILKYSYADPRYDVKGQRVLIKERAFLYGLNIAERNVGLTTLNPAEATDIFIREALVAGQLKDIFPFFEHNQELRMQVEEWQTRLRRSTAWHLDDRVYDFYARKLRGVGSVHELRAYIRDEFKGSQDPLFMTREDLIAEQEEDTLNAEFFPDGVTFNGSQFDVNYAYKPGQDDDGATLKVPIGQFEALQSGMLDWIVPGYLKERVEILLRSLPKEIRRDLFPIGDKAQELCMRLEPSPRPLTEQLSERILQDYGVRVWPKDWPEDAVPDYLRPRIELTDNDAQVIAAGRDWQRVQSLYKETIRKAAETGEDNDSLTVWKKARARYERPQLVEWSFGSLPEFVEIGSLAGVPVRAYPGLCVEGQSIHLRLFTNAREAALKTRPAWRKLCALGCGKDLVWFEKDLKQELRRANLLEHSLNLLHRHLFPIDKCWPLQETCYRELVDSAQKAMRGLPQKYVDALHEVLEWRHKLTLSSGYAGMRTDLFRLIPDDFLLRVDYARLQRMPAYFRAMEIRSKRAATHAARDAEKLKQVQPYIDKLNPMAREASTVLRRRLYSDFFWLLEEYKISIFAQEVGTSVKVSPKRLDAIFAEFSSAPKK